LVVAADQDYTPLETKEVFIQQIPNAKMEVIVDTHHAAPIERPEEFNRILEDFLRAHP
jgi:pimeloyl-ACP methyl ester carboxylesterase